MAVQNLLIYKQPSSEIANFDRIQRFESWAAVREVYVGGGLEAICQVDVYPMEQLLELCAGGVIQIFEMAKV